LMWFISAIEDRCTNLRTRFSS